MSKDIKKIIAFLDSYLTTKNLSEINPIVANEILAKAGLLRNSVDRAGKPLRELLRKGLLPHAFQLGGKGSSWVIPHSKKEPSKTIVTSPITTRIEKTTQIPEVAQISKGKNSQLAEKLMNEESFNNANSVDNLIPHNAGLYCIRIKNPKLLPKPFHLALAERKHNIIYIGIARKSLKKRLLDQEIRAKGHGTFFRSIGAVLGYRPTKGSLINKTNKNNYKFSTADEQRIIKWINDNLKINWITVSGDFETLEDELIKKYKPLINIAKNPYYLQELLDLRKLCVQIANEQ